MKIVSCGIKDKFRLLLFVAFEVFWIASSFCERYLNGILTLNAFFLLLMVFIGKCLSGFLELILQWKSKSITPKVEIEVNLSYSKYNSILSRALVKKRLNLYNYALIALIPLLDMSQLYWNNILKANYIDRSIQNRYQLKGFQIFPAVLFYKYFIKDKQFFHHLISLIMIAIALIAIMINAFIISEDKNALLLLELQYMGMFIIIALTDTMNKWLMDNKGVSVYMLLFFQGVVGIVMIIILIFAVPTESQSSSTMESFSQSAIRVFSSYFYILLVVGNVLMQCGYYIFVLLAIKYFTAIHKAVCESLYTFLWIPEAYVFSELGDVHNYITYIIGYVVIGIFGLIYNEIIVIHLCRLDENTNIQIKSRSVREVAMVLQDAQVIEGNDEMLIDNEVML